MRTAPSTEPLPNPFLHVGIWGEFPRNSRLRQYQGQCTENQTIQPLSSSKQPQARLFVYLGINPSKLLGKNPTFIFVLVQKFEQILPVLFGSGTNQITRDLWGGKTFIRVLVQNNRFILGLVSSWGCSKGGGSPPSGGPDLAQISDSVRGGSPEADGEGGGI